MTPKATIIVPASSAIIVREDGRILAQRRADNGRWGLPGGVMEIGESIADATRREVKEETGLDVEIVRLLGIYSDPADQTVSYPDGNVMHHVSASFECRVTGGTLVANPEESLALEWIDPRALPEPFVPAQRPRVLDWLAGPPAPVVK